MKDKIHLQLCIPNTQFKISIYSADIIFLHILSEILQPYIYEEKIDNSCIDKQYGNLDTHDIVIGVEGAYKKYKLEENTAIGQTCRILQGIQRSINPWNLYHGAAMHIKGKTIVFLGDSGTGKTTLIAYLLNTSKESMYLSEDVLIINSENNMLIPYPRPLLLRREGKNLLQEKYCISFDYASCIAYGEYFRYVIKSSSIFEKKYTVDGYIKLKRNESEHFYVDKIIENRGDTILSSCYLPNNIRNNVISSIKLANRSRLYEISYSDLDLFAKKLYNIIDLL